MKKKKKLKIIKEGNKGGNFKNKKDAKAYLKYLKENREEYIRNEVHNKFLGSFVISTVILIVLYFKLDFIIAYSISILLLAANILLHKLYCWNTNKKFDNRLLQIKKEYLSEDNTKKDLIKELEQTREADNFIISIKIDIDKIFKIKYKGYKEDIADLYNLLLEYLEAKKRHKTTSENDVMYANLNFYKAYNILSERIQKNIKINLDQSRNNEIVEDIKRAIEREDIEVNHKSITRKLTKDQDIKLKL